MPLHLPRKITLLVLVSLTPLLTQAKEYPDIKIDQLITKNDARKIGYSKLSKAEREALRITLINLYLQGHKEGKDTGVKEGISRAAKAIAGGGVGGVRGGAIESKIDGEFNGWEGETIVKLMNGQIWQQTDFQMKITYKFMPKVTIYQSNGITKMIVDGTNKAVAVTRLK
ncbi:hypothetical protein ACFSW8_01275 [Rubritalea tangerina]|uniref:Uncharacterized protein n=2 Tax=Rubritalea tangerina TaxID=430798 RepID=A0ABW4Z6L0_9BACT